MRNQSVVVWGEAALKAKKKGVLDMKLKMSGANLLWEKNGETWICANKEELLEMGSNNIVV